MITLLEGSFQARMRSVAVTTDMFRIILYGDGPEH